MAIDELDDLVMSAGSLGIDPGKYDALARRVHDALVRELGERAAGSTAISFARRLSALSKDAPRVPLLGRIRVSHDDVWPLLDQLRAHAPLEIKSAREAS